MEKIVAEIIQKELENGVNCLVSNINKVLNYHDSSNFTDFNNLKSEFKKEMSYLYTDITKKMDHQEKHFLSVLDIQNPINQDVIFDQCKKAIRPLEDDIFELRKNIKNMEKSLARELEKISQEN